jgi:hypothetical protein
MGKIRTAKTGWGDFPTGVGYSKIILATEGSHSGLVRAPAKRLPWVTGVEGSNPSPSATQARIK